MTINDDTIMNLPRKADPNTPSANPEFVTALAQAWYAEVAAQPDFDLALAIPEAGPYRASYAGKRCDRELWYAMNKVEQSNPPGVATQWSFEIGHRAHEMLQHAVTKIHPYSRAEVDVDLNSIGIAGSAHADLVTYDPCEVCSGTGEGDHVVQAGIDGSDVESICEPCDGSGLGVPDAVLEIKTVNATGFATMCTRDRGPAEGPRSGHVMQAAMVAAALGARRIVIIYAALECFSNWRHAKYAFDQADTGKFTAEFAYDMADLIDDVRAEAKRIRWVGKQEVRPPRRINSPEFPIGSIVDDPQTGNYYVKPEYDEKGQLSNFTGMGSYWGCAYCNWRDRCTGDGR